MICIPKRDNTGIRTVVDCRKRNLNTVKDVTPFLDQEQIRMGVARAPVRSKIDLSDAYEQIRIELEDVHKTAFATVYGTMLSNVLQQGDCNAVATYQSIMNFIFGPYIGVFMFVYLDDIIIFSDTLEDHVRHVKLIIDVLREQQFFLGKPKIKLLCRELVDFGAL